MIDLITNRNEYNTKIISKLLFVVNILILNTATVTIILRTI